MVRSCTQKAGHTADSNPPIFTHTEMGVIYEEPTFCLLLYCACLNEQRVGVTLGEDHSCFSRLFMSAVAFTHLGRTGLGYSDWFLR